jgi:hypothetical protein
MVQPCPFERVECPEAFDRAHDRPVEGLSFLYIINCDDGSFYIGQSKDLAERLRKHRYALASKLTLPITTRLASSTWRGPTLSKMPQ